jgi:hypothetical protein
MIKSAVAAGYKPNEIRDMIPLDTFIVFDGWNEAHSPKKPGSDAPSLEKVRALAERYG